MKFIIERTSSENKPCDEAKKKKLIFFSDYNLNSIKEATKKYAWIKQQNAVQKRRIRKSFFKKKN